MDAKTVKYWINEVHSSEEFQKRELIERNCYPDIIEYYEGKLNFKPAVEASTSKLEAIINEYFPNANSLVADIMYKFPEITVEARKEEAEISVDLMKSALEYAVKKTGAIDELRLSVFDMIFAGYTAIEVGHILDEPENPETSDAQAIINQTDKGLIGTGFDFIKKTFAGNTEDKVESELASPEESYATTEMTYVRRLDPLNVLFDYRASRTKDMRYIVKKNLMSKAEFNVRYPKFRDKVRATGGKIEYSGHDNQEYNQQVVVFELQIKKRNGVYTNVHLTPSLETECLEEYDRPYIANGFDIKIGSFHKYGKLYPISIARINKYINDRQNSYARYMMEVAQRTIPKIVATSGVDTKALEALKSSLVNDIAVIDRGENISGVEYGKVSTENKELLQIFAQQKEKLWSVSESRLTGKSNSEFATEIQIQEAGFLAKQGDLQEGLRLVIVEVVEELKDIIKQLWDGEYFFKVTGKDMPNWYATDVRMIDGVETPLNPLTDLIQGDYDVNVDISSSMRPNKEKKKTDVAQFLEFLLKFAQVMGLQIDPEFIKRTVVDWGYNPENVFLEQAPMMPIAPGMEAAPTPMELAMQDQGMTPEVPNAVI